MRESILPELAGHLWAIAPSGMNSKPVGPVFVVVFIVLFVLAGSFILYKKLKK